MKSGQAKLGAVKFDDLHPREKSRGSRGHSFEMSKRQFAMTSNVLNSKLSRSKSFTFKFFFPP